MYIYIQVDFKLTYSNEKNSCNIYEINVRKSDRCDCCSCLGYMIYTHFLSRPTMIKIQKGKHVYNDNQDCWDKLSICQDEHDFPYGDASECFDQFHKCYGK